MWFLSGSDTAVERICIRSRSFFGLTFLASASVTLMHVDSPCASGEVLGYLAAQVERVHVLPRQVPGRTV